MALRYWLGGTVVAAITLTAGCASTLSGRYANATGTSVITLNADGSGSAEVSMRMFGQSSPYDSRERFLYKIRGNRIKIDMIDSRTGQVYVPSSKVEADMMRPLAEGSLSYDRKTLHIIGDTFTRQQ